MVEYTGNSPMDSNSNSLDVHKSAWNRTLQEMDMLYEDLESDGWQVLAFPAGHTGPEVPVDGDDSNTRFGLTHLIPGNKADDLVEMVDENSYDDYQVFKNIVHGVEFVLTVLQDESAKSAILIAANYQQQRASPLKDLVMDEETMYTHIRTLDGTYIASFEHEDPTHFFPESDDA